jgi:REP element-mobilizing transposase RayT
MNDTGGMIQGTVPCLDNIFKLSYTAPEVIKMPRTARKLSKTETYHVMMRGVNNQQIFNDDEDCVTFLTFLKECKDISGFKLYAYCLMGNHIHLLLQTGKEGLAQTIKRLGTKYAYRYNLKYNRIGHLFQDRFKSEPIEDDRYFFAALRYIHQNPVKAGLAKRIDRYRWSSYGEYINGFVLVDKDSAPAALDKKEFIDFNKTKNNDVFLEIDAKPPRLSDVDVKAMLKSLTGFDTAEDFQTLDAQTKKFYLRNLKEKGASIRQINRLTGVSKGIVERA